MILISLVSIKEGDAYDTPHIIMTYVALLSLAILRDDFSKLERSGIIKLLQTCQREDGRFASFPDNHYRDR